MPRIEVVYHTNLDQEETLKRLAFSDIKCLLETEQSPRGIAQLEWRGQGKVKCQLGSTGGVNIHYDYEADLEQFLQLLKAQGVYLQRLVQVPGQDPEQGQPNNPMWIKVKEYFHVKLPKGAERSLIIQTEAATGKQRRFYSIMVPAGEPFPGQDLQE